MFERQQRGGKRMSNGPVKLLSGTSVVVLEKLPGLSIRNRVDVKQGVTKKDHIRSARSCHGEIVKGKKLLSSL